MEVITGEIITTQIENFEWYQLLVEDCKAIITEAVFTSRWALVEGYHQLGERIVTDENYKKEAKGNHSSLQGLAKNLNVSERTLYYAIQFYEKYPNINKLPEGKNITWNKIITKYLPDKNWRQIPENPARGGLMWQVEQGDINTYLLDEGFDFIITDPPYPKEYLPLYEVLAKRALEWLKPGGLLVVMCGQSYLDQIYSMMSKHLTYYWTGSYMTPGQASNLRHKQVNTQWKPLVMFTIPGDKYSGKIFGDVFVSNANEKDYHDWGQSVGGMISIVSQICLPGQSILDPFCGAGTTGIAAIRNNDYFYGFDIDDNNVSISRDRLEKASKNVGFIVDIPIGKPVFTGSSSQE